MNKPISISRILAPVEFSDRCRGAACYGLALARHFQAELTLLNVVTPPYVGYGDVGAYCSTDYFESRWEQSKTDLEAFLKDEVPADVHMHRMLLEGDPAHRIVEYAHNEKFDLLVMATHGYGPVRRFLLGSVTAKVLHDAECPVWTGSHMERTAVSTELPPRHIVCALDLGPQSCTTMGWAAGLARQFSAHLTILHALPASAVSVGGYAFDPEWRIHLEHEARERITQVQQQLQITGDVRVVVGDAPLAVSQAVESLHADLLVIGRSHKSGVMGRLRPTAYGILRESPCPVVSI